MDHLHRRMDYGEVGMRDGKGQIPNLIPKDEDDIPGSFFLHVWEIVDYAMKILEEDFQKRMEGRDITEENVEGVNSSQVELNGAAETSALEARVEDLALKV